MLSVIFIEHNICDRAYIDQSFDSVDTQTTALGDC